MITAVDVPITLPTSGETVSGARPVVILGPNGSGKTRQSRSLNAPEPVNFINALRNTRVPSELPAMGVDSARSNYSNQMINARSNPSELHGEFDSLMSKLLAQQSSVAIAYMRERGRTGTNAGPPKVTPLTQVERIWGRVFPGREIEWPDWKPTVKNSTSGSPVEYSGNGMSDGEKAVIYLAGRVFDADAGVLVVDEPETHLHTLLAARLWNTLEDERPDIRFVYVTHDLNFALSRREATFVLASPLSGLRTFDLAGRVPEDVTEALLGSASLSFYASRVVFCEGEESSLDGELYRSWFNGSDTVVKSVGTRDRVLRCVDALRSADVTTSLTAIGIIDRDNHPVAFLESLPDGVFGLAVHEIESLYSLPSIVAAICSHVGRDYSADTYMDMIKNTVAPSQEEQIVVDRWKARIEPRLSALVSGVSRTTPTTELTRRIPELFDPSKWTFDPYTFLTEESERVETALASSDIVELLAIIPGKQVLSIAARMTGLASGDYCRLVTKSLRGLDDELKSLGERIAQSLTSYLPTRHVAAALPSSIA